MSCTTFARVRWRRVDRLWGPGAYRPATGQTTGRRLRRVTLVALAAITTLAGCAENEGERRFANDPVPTARVSPSPIVAERPTPTTAPLPPSPEALLRARGAPRTTFVVADRELLALPADSPEPSVLLSPADSAIRAVASSPSGDRVAVLLATESGDQTRADLLVLMADGAELRRLDGLADLPSEVASATPWSLTWSPQGRQLLASIAGSGISSIPVDEGDPVLLVPTGDTHHPGKAAWSPAGDFVAYLAATGADRGADLFLLAPGTGTPGPASSRLVAASERGRTVTDLAWLADGTAILFTEHLLPGAEPSSGDLFSIQPDGADLRVVASAGSVSPVGEVTDFRPAPDGRSIAYVISTPGEQGTSFISLWVRPIGGGPAMQLEVPRDVSITDLWWTASGVTFRAVPFSSGTVDYSGGPFIIYRAAAVGAPEQLLAAATPIATPAASPVASPSAATGSPVATPAAD